MKTPMILLSGAVCALVAFSAAPALADPAYATRNVNMRSGPGLNYEVVDQLVQSEPVDRSNCTADGTWCFVRHEGANGWVAAVFLTTTPPGQPQTPPQTPPATQPPANSNAYKATSSVNVRSGPGPGFSVVDRLDAGEAVTRGDCSSDGAWCYVTHDGADGWVAASFLVPVQSTTPSPPPPQNPPAATTRIARSAVNVRTGPGTSYSAVDRLDVGERVTLGQCSPDGVWCYITHDGPDGWVSASFLGLPSSGPGGQNPGGQNPGGQNPGGQNPGGQNPGGGAPPTIIQKIGTAIASMPVRAAATLFTSTVGRLERGDKIPVVSCTDDGYWCRVKDDTLDGWVPAAFLTISEVRVPAPLPSNAAVTVQATQLRQNPGNFGPVVANVPAGATVTVQQCGPSGNWCQVAYGNASGWLSAALLKAPDTAPPAPPSPSQPNQVCVTGFGGIQFCVGQ